MASGSLRLRLFFIHYAAILAVGAYWVQLDFVRERMAHPSHVTCFYVLCAVTLGYWSVRAYFELRRGLSPFWEWAALVADVIVITIAVHLTGGIRSEAALLYFWPIATSSIQRRWQRTLAAGLLSAGLYVAVARHWEGYTLYQYQSMLATRVFIILIATSLAISFAVAEAGRVEELTRLRERVALGDYRAGLSREMHDGIQHYLAHAAMRLELAGRLIESDPAAAARMAVDQRLTIRHAADELRYLVRQLRSQAVERLGFVAAVRRHLESLREHTDLDALLTVEGDERALPPAVELAAFRIVQEALTNTEKHAKASRVEVRLRYEPEAFECSILDDGVGFDREAIREAAFGGVGLESLTERAEAIGGEIRIESAPGEGTRVRLMCPRK